MRMTSAKHPSVMKNSLPILSTLDFRYYSEDRLFICERSDLKGKRILGRVCSTMRATKVSSCVRIRLGAK
jgi:hypothetical protein